MRPSIRSVRMPSAMAIAIVLALSVLSDRAAAAADAAQPIRGFYDTLLRTMQNGPSLGQRGRYAALEPVVLSTFDIPYMTRMAVGAVLGGGSRGKAAPADRGVRPLCHGDLGRSVRQLLRREARGHGERPYGPAMLVETRIVKSDGEPVAISYLMRHNGDAWQIGDVYLTGTISELATQRSQFSSILSREGVDGLIAALNRKAGNIVAAAARF